MRDFLDVLCLVLKELGIQIACQSAARLNQGIESYVYVTLFARMRLHLFRLSVVRLFDLHLCVNS